MYKPVLIGRRALPLGAASAMPCYAMAKPALAKPEASRPLIVLGPGHGGRDPGAVGATGLLEKHVALETALDLRCALQAGDRYRVVVTRDDDFYIPLEDRVAFAERHGARLFVSIHADALRDRSVRGTSVYTGSRHASDAQAAEVAEIENSADDGDHRSFANVPPEVASILESLMSRETRTSSVRLQRDIVKALGQDIGLLKNPARHANFVVLRSSSIPSALVEMAFMSNRKDEELLRTTKFRNAVVASLRNSIDGCMTNLMAASSDG